ncbi:MAG: DUF1800 family protein [Dongiaceae bacterium]
MSRRIETVMKEAGKITKPVDDSLMKETASIAVVSDSVKVEEDEKISSRLPLTVTASLLDNGGQLQLDGQQLQLSSTQIDGLRIIEVAQLLRRGPARGGSGGVVVVDGNLPQPQGAVIHSLESELAMHRFGFAGTPEEKQMILSTPGGPRAYLRNQLTLDGTDLMTGICTPGQQTALYFTVQRENSSAPMNIQRRMYGLPDLSWSDLQNSFNMERENFTRNVANTQRPFLARLMMFWANHFTIRFNVTTDSNVWNRNQQFPYYVHTILPNVLGNFATMLKQVVRSPAMMFHLNYYNMREGFINQDFAREVMELFTVSTAGGYTQTDIEALGKILTGLCAHMGYDSLTATQARQLHGIPADVAHPLMPGDPFVYWPNFMRYSNPQTRAPHHIPFLNYTQNRPYYDAQGRTLLTPEQVLDEVLDLLARHPATARHIARKMLEYFVSDTPDEGAINRLAQVFMDNANAPDQLKRVAEAMIDEDSSWLSAANNSNIAYRRKQPVNAVFGVLRSCRLLSYNLPAEERQLIRDVYTRYLPSMGQPLDTPPDVAGFRPYARVWHEGQKMMSYIDMARQLTSMAASRVTAQQVFLTNVASMAQASPTSQTSLVYQQAGSNEQLRMPLVLSSLEFLGS